TCVHAPVVRVSDPAWATLGLARNVRTCAGLPAAKMNRAGWGLFRTAARLSPGAPVVNLPRTMNHVVFCPLRRSGDSRDDLAPPLRCHSSEAGHVHVERRSWRRETRDHI